MLEIDGGAGHGFNARRAEAHQHLRLEIRDRRRNYGARYFLILPLYFSAVVGERRLHCSNQSFFDGRVILLRSKAERYLVPCEVDAMNLLEQAGRDLKNNRI